MVDQNKKFRVLNGDVVHGPFTRAELIKLYDEGRFQWSELVSVREGPWLKFDQLFPEAATEPPEYILPAVPTDGEGIFFVFKGKKQGPVTETDLRSMLQSEEIKTTTSVWKKGFKKWVRLEESGLIDDSVGTYRISDDQI